MYLIVLFVPHIPTFSLLHSHQSFPNTLPPFSPHGYFSSFSNTLCQLTISYHIFPSYNLLHILLQKVYLLSTISPTISPKIFTQHSLTIFSYTSYTKVYFVPQQNIPISYPILIHTLIHTFVHTYNTPLYTH